MLQVVSACIARDLPVYRVTFQSLRRFLPDAEIHVITRKQDFPRFREACGSELHLWDEATLLPGMTLGQLRELPLPFFPKGAGWYFQQFLKYAFVDVSNQDDYYLIWDADTVLLRPLEFFDEDGKPIYTSAVEHHLPYFETFKNLFGVEAVREFSFISQHQVISKKILKEMLHEIEARNPDQPNWAWAIMKNLAGEGSNLFSEYETYGHYLKLRYPGDYSIRKRKWTRHGERGAGYPPKPNRLPALAESYDFAAFEAMFSMRNRIKRFLQRLKNPGIAKGYAEEA